MPTEREDLLHAAFIRSARRRWSTLALADTTGRELSFGRALTGSILLTEWIRRNCEGERMIGILLPASVGGALANIAVPMAGSIPVNLNFTTGPEVLASCIERCAIRTIFTSRRFLDKAKLEERQGMVFLEDLLPKFGRLAKLRAALMAKLMPAARLIERFGGGAAADSVATVIFSSGSTGEPKGVLLSHRNVLSNIDSSMSLFALNDDDRVAGVLPFFHSFGFAFTLWFPLVSGHSAVYHPNPTEAQAVGNLVRQYKATFLLATPTFCQSYARKCTPEQFQSLRYVIVGAEKLREQVAALFRERFGLELLEGYGCTEMSPVVAVNRPEANRPGTVGPPIPGVRARIVDVETGSDLPRGEEGLLLVAGPNRMIGYLDDPEQTRNAMRDEWYITGDIGRIEEDGAIRLTDRLARFSKIGGELVPHARVEEALEDLLPEREFVVSGVPDERKGERLVLLHTGDPVDARDLYVKLGDRGLPNLWLPKPHDIYMVESIPLLGTGKLDLRGVKTLAKTRAAGLPARQVRNDSRLQA